jgi:MobA/VirD2-like, nuclease domain
MIADMKLDDGQFRAGAAGVALRTRAAPTDKTLSDDEWAQSAHDVMNRTGLVWPGEEDEAVRWIAVRHADDHIHLVVMLARQDGRSPSIRNDRYRVRDACRAAERRYGLRSTSPADRTAPRYPTRAENEKATRQGLEEAPRVTLRRAVNLAAASSETAEEFFARLEAARVTVRPRYSTKNPGQVTGYAVALNGDVTKDGTPVWYSGGKLAADLARYDSSYQPTQE